MTVRLLRPSRSTLNKGSFSNIVGICRSCLREEHLYIDSLYHYKKVTATGPSRLELDIEPALSLLSSVVVIQFVLLFDGLTASVLALKLWCISCAHFLF
jgi:hypothetical protein